MLPIIIILVFVVVALAAFAIGSIFDQRSLTGPPAPRTPVLGRKDNRDPIDERSCFIARSRC